MGLFNRNPNEAAYTGGKKHFADVIKNSGPEDALIWRMPEEDFNTKSTLIVGRGESAIFIKGGEIVETFTTSGTYPLTTENYPFISRLRNAFTGGISTFNCVVYFFRRADSREIGWGWGETSPCRVNDPKYKVGVNLLATGKFKVMIDNPGVFLDRVAGNIQGISEDDFFEERIRGMVIQTVKTALKRTIESGTDPSKDIIDKIGDLEYLQAEVEPLLRDKILDEMGVTLRYFVFEKATPVDNDPGYTRILETQTKIMTNIQEMREYGDDWQRIQSRDIMSNISQNEGGGGIAAAGAGLGMGMAAGSMFGNMAQQVFSNPQPQQQAPQQPAAPAPQENPVEKLKQLKDMLDMGLLSQEEFDAKKQDILSRM